MARKLARPTTRAQGPLCPNQLRAGRRIIAPHPMATAMMTTVMTKVCLPTHLFLSLVPVARP